MQLSLMAGVWDNRRDSEVTQTLAMLSRRRTLEVQSAKLDILARRQARLALEEISSLIDAQVTTVLSGWGSDVSMYLSDIPFVFIDSEEGRCPKS